MCIFSRKVWMHGVIFIPKLCRVSTEKKNETKLQWNNYKNEKFSSSFNTFFVCMFLFFSWRQINTTEWTCRQNVWTLAALLTHDPLRKTGWAASMRRHLIHQGQRGDRPADWFHSLEEIRRNLVCDLNTNLCDDTNELIIASVIFAVRAFCSW